MVWNADWHTPAWSLPGGAREPGESLADAAIRETKEETGYTVRVGNLIDVHEIIGLGGRIHLDIFTFAGEIVSGELVEDGTSEPKPGEVTQAKWFSLEEAASMSVVGRILLPMITGDNDTSVCQYSFRGDSQSA